MHLRLLRPTRDCDARSVLSSRGRSSKVELRGERRAGSGTWVPPPKPTAEARAGGSLEVLLCLEPGPRVPGRGNACAHVPGRGPAATPGTLAWRRGLSCPGVPSTSQAVPLGLQAFHRHSSPCGPWQPCSWVRAAGHKGSDWSPGCSPGDGPAVRPPPGGRAWCCLLPAVHTLPPPQGPCPSQPRHPRPGGPPLGELQVPQPPGQGGESRDGRSSSGASPVALPRGPAPWSRHNRVGVASAAHSSRSCQASVDIPAAPRLA